MRVLHGWPPLSSSTALLVILTLCSWRPAASLADASIVNPIMRGADPYVMRLDDVYYVMVTRQFDIAIYPVTSLEDLETTDPERVWCINKQIVTDIWAPEFAKVNGTWHIISTGRDASGIFRLFSLASTVPDDPLGPYEWAGLLNTTQAIDGSVFEFRDKQYITYSQFIAGPGQGGQQQCIFLSELLSATTVGRGTMLSCPWYKWEFVGNYVNEAPQAVINNNKLFILYSASLTWTPEYCLGQLSFSNASGADPLNATEWTKSQKPVFDHKNTKGVWGPGHHSATTTTNGSWLLMYHVKSTNNFTDLDRVLQAKLFDWDDDGQPVLGNPPHFDFPPAELLKLKEGNDCPDPA